MLVLENINVTLGKGSRLERRVLKNLNLTVEKGEFLVIIGGNGAGKSTLFNVISGFLKPDGGKIFLEGQEITQTPSLSRCGTLAKVMQDPRVGTLEQMSIFENMAFAYNRGKRRKLIPFSNRHRLKLFREKLLQLDMGLENRLDDLVINLSGGQRQALSLIMATLSDSKILLLDEMTAALDPRTAESVMRLADKMVREENRTCLMITHNMTHALTYGDRTLLLSEGIFVKEFTALEKKDLTAVALAAEFGEV